MPIDDEWPTYLPIYPRTKVNQTSGHVSPTVRMRHLYGRTSYVTDLTLCDTCHTPATSKRTLLICLAHYNSQLEVHQASFILPHIFNAVVPDTGSIEIKKKEQKTDTPTTLVLLTECNVL